MIGVIGVFIGVKFLVFHVEHLGAGGSEEYGGLGVGDGDGWGGGEFGGEGGWGAG